MIGFSLFLFFIFISAKPLRRVRDINADIWEEYFDDQTQHFYYYKPTTKTTAWLLEFPTEPTATFDITDQIPSINKEKTTVIQKKAPIYSILTKNREMNTLAMLFKPVDAETLHLLKDPAGSLRTRNFTTVFDDLLGIKARVNYPIPLKAPLAFHQMFSPSNGLQKSSITSERNVIEALLLDQPNNHDGWESLGHVWRVGAIILFPPTLISFNLLVCLDVRRY
jgi:hypothetical protein